MIGVLWWLSLRTQGDYEDRRSGVGAPTSPDWALSDPLLWCGAPPVKRQRSVHLLAASATVLSDAGPAALGDPGLGPSGRVGVAIVVGRRGGGPHPVGLDRPRRRAAADRPAARCSTGSS